MNADELRQRLPQASEDFIRRNTTPPPPPPNLNRVVAAGAPKKRLRQQQGDGLNATERAFGLHVHSQHHGSAILPQSITLKLANGVRYTPDYFAVEVVADHTCDRDCHIIHAYEVKGFMRDDAAVKLKIAARVYPWIKFHLVTKKKKKDGGGWNIQEILP